MGRRKLKFDVQKNYEKKNYFKLNVRIPLELTKQFGVSVHMYNCTHAPAVSEQSLVEDCEDTNFYPTGQKQQSITSTRSCIYRAVNASDTPKCCPVHSKVLATTIFS